MLQWAGILHREQFFAKGGAMNKKASAHARALAELGAAKGGKARAESLTPEQRTEIARHAAQKRWGGRSGIPYATHGDPSRPLRIADLEIPCYVLADGRRVVIQRGMMNALQMAQGTAGRGPGDRLAKFARGKSIEPFISSQLTYMINNPIKFRTPGGSIAYGYEATILADLCDAVLAARKAGKLHHQQRHIAEQCEILVRGFARVGIIALVDEVTGYEADKAKDDLMRILESYISEELFPWTKRFPDTFFQEIYRLQGWEFREGQHKHKRPQFVGQLINKLIYGKLPPGVLPELQRRNPTRLTGYRRYRHHQFLTEDIGHPHLDKQVTAVMTLMRASDDKEMFKRLFGKAFPEKGQQLSLNYSDEEN